MLGRKTKSNETTKINAPVTSTGALNSLVIGTTVDGNIVADSDFRIDGKLVGNLSGKAKIIIGVEGHVSGEIQCENAIVEGKFDGVLIVRNQLHVKNTAQIEGRIQVKDLIVESGAAFNVKCEMGNFSSSPKPLKKVIANKEIVAQL